MSDEGIRDRLVALLNTLSTEWRFVDAADNLPLYLLCAAGLVELQFSGRARTDKTSLDFEATVCGVWLDVERQSILPDELRRAVPAWAKSAIAVQLNTPYRAKLTRHGETCKQDVHANGSWGLLEYVCLNPIRGRARVRILGNEAPAPGAVATDNVAGEIVKALRGNEQAVWQTAPRGESDPAPDAAKTVAQSPAPDPAPPAPPINEVFVDATAAVRLIVGGKHTPGVSRLVEIRHLEETVDRKLYLMGKTGLLLPDVSAAKLANFLNVTATAIKKTRWWKTRMAMRRQQKADANSPYIQKHGPRRPRWKRRGSGPALEPPKG